MAELEIGNIAPDFEIKNQDGVIVKSSDLKGKWTIIYFYPKDNTPGCSTEAIEFSYYKKDMEDVGVKIIGISRDSIESHKKFIEKKSLTIELLSSEESDMTEKYGVWQLKKNYGKEYMGIVRTTYIISPDLKIAEVYKKVKVNGHAGKVVNRVKELING